MNAILDTGPWVALIDRSESKHKLSTDWLQAYKGKLFTTEANLTEVLYLLNFSIMAQTAALDFVLHSVVEIVPSTKSSLKKSQELIIKYNDLPMDFADATLVTLAVDTGVYKIVTFDYKDFSIYKPAKQEHFQLMP